MDKPLFFEDYLKYIAENPNTKAYKQFKCSAWIGRDPFLIGATPVGRFYLYPELAAFLTTSKAKPGGFREFSSALWQQELKPLYYMIKWSHHPASILLDVAKTLYQHVGDKETKFINEALSSPNSFFIPLSKVKNVKAERNLRGNFIRIYAAEKELVLYNNVRASWTWVGPLYAQITGKWQDDVVAVLSETAGKNQLKELEYS